MTATACRAARALRGREVRSRLPAPPPSPQPSPALRERESNALAFPQQRVQQNRTKRRSANTAHFEITEGERVVARSED